MPITHIVMFQFNDAADVKHMSERLVALKDECVSPTTGKPYILSLKGGKDNSPEAMQHGITHAFVVEFANVEDRDYYVSKDPAHLAFVKSLDGKIEKAQAIDFEGGVY